MYKNLEKVLKDLKITQTELSSYLQYNNPKTLHLRIKKDVMFKDTEMKKIYEYLKRKGFKGKKSYLFDYSDYVVNKKEKTKTRFSVFLDKYIKENNTTNEELSRILHYHPNTISNWRSGKIEITKLPFDEINNIAKTLNVPVGELLGFESYTEQYTNKGFEMRSYNKNQLYCDLYELLIIFQEKERNYVDLRTKIDNHFKEHTLMEMIKEFVHSFNEVIDNKYIHTLKDLEDSNDFQDLIYMFDSTKNDLEQLAQKYNDLIQDPIKNKQSIAEIEKEMFDYRNKFIKFYDDTSTSATPIELIAKKHGGKNNGKK